MKMEVKNPRRILFVGAPDCAALDVVKSLTGSAPQPNKNGSTAGLTHEWNAQTAYYTAKIPIWVDEIGDLDAWKSDFSRPEAQEVVEAVGAWIYCFRAPQDGTVSKHVEDIMAAIQSVIDEHVGYGADTISLAVAMPTKSGGIFEAVKNQEQWEDTAMQYNFEYIQYGTEGKNEFGEKVGFERLKEALEAHDWAAASSLDVDMLGLGEIDEGENVGDFTHEEAEMTAELYGMKSALLGDDWEPDAGLFGSTSDEAAQVENLDRMMGKLLAVREQSADLPEAQRKKLAAKAVRELIEEGG